MHSLLRVMQRTSRSSLNKQFGEHAYKTDHYAKRNAFQSSSFAAVDTFKNIGTQTSKTVVALDSLRMSPDSLSPRTVYESDPLPYLRKNCILKYLHPQKSNRQEERKIPDNSLTKVFLDKKQVEGSSGALSTTRARFLQQTSPLRNLPESPMKSQSFVEPKIPSRRFQVAQVRERPPVEKQPKPVRYFCEKELNLNLNAIEITPKANKTFMSPTFASEQKNKMREINVVTQLISPTRKGKTTSPKADAEGKRQSAKVPYIDTSSSTIFQHQGCASVEDRAGSVSDLTPKPSATASSLRTISCSTIMENDVQGSGTEHDLFQAITKLRDLDWNTAIRGLAEVVEICRITDADFVYPHMTAVNQRIIDLLKSPRSHVCRTTCQAIGHLFEYVRDTRRPEYDEIVDILLCRTADSNKFIRRDANLALDCMVTHIPILHAIRAICTKGPDHKNSLVRTASARLVVCAAVMAGPQAILNPNASDYTRRRIVLNMVKFLNDKTYETRKYGERLYKLLSTDKLFDFYLHRYLERDTISQIKLCLKIKPNGKK